MRTIKNICIITIIIAFIACNNNPQHTQKSKKSQETHVENTEKLKSLTENKKNHTEQSSVETKIIEKTKEKFKEENKQVIILKTSDGEKIGIYDLDNTTAQSMVFKEGRKLYFSLMNAEDNKEPVLLKIIDDFGETIKEVDSKLNKINYFSLTPKKTGEYMMEAHFENEQGEALLFLYLVE